ncbi:MAG: hypothetical protein JRL30_25550 [Deltaproteobacteria bacterium]|nr:hypothetical protein [Deltaproteobacteria bacterium]
MAYHILTRFPEKKDNIDLLMTQDPEFLALCEDYDACVNALQYWAGSKMPKAKIRVNEYRMLIQELQDEISQALEAPKPRRLD